jgi:hypothetical protein
MDLYMGISGTGSVKTGIGSVEVLSPERERESERYWVY